jgi:hypothetical protein
VVVTPIPVSLVLLLGSSIPIYVSVMPLLPIDMPGAIFVLIKIVIIVMMLVIHVVMIIVVVITIVIPITILCQQAGRNK